MMKIFNNIKGIKFCGLFLLAMMFAWMPNASAQKLDDDAHQLLSRAYELMDKTRTAQEEAELTSLLQQAKQDSSIPPLQKKSLVNFYNSKNVQRFEKLLTSSPSSEMMQELGQLQEQILADSKFLGKEMDSSLLFKYERKQDEYDNLRVKELQKKGILRTSEEQDELDQLMSKIDSKHADLETQKKNLEQALEDPNLSWKERYFLKQKLNWTDVSLFNESLRKRTLDVCNNNCAPKCFYKEMTTCSFCPLFATVFNAASTIAQHAINTFSGSIMKVVIIAFGIWIAMQVLAFVATPEVRDLKDLASSLITQSFVVMLVVIILDGGAMNFFNYALTPVYTTGQNLAQTIIKPGTTATSYQGAANASDIQKKLDEDANRPCNNDLSGIYDDAKGEGALPKAMGDSIICTMTLIQNRVAQVKALGSASICKSWQEKFFIIPHLNYLLIGVGLWVGAMVLLLAVPFMMVDAIFELAVAAALLPFAIGSYAFKITRGYSKKVWETFLNSMFQFVFVSLVTLMLVVAYQSIITGSTGDLSYMFENENGAVLTDLLVKLPWFSTAFLKLCFVMILAWSVLSAAKDFAGEFAGSISNTSIGSSIGTMAGSFTKSAALKIAKPTAEATAEHLGRGIRAAAVAPVHYARRAAMNYRASRIKKNGQFNPETGQYTLETTHWWGKKKLTLVENADGSKSVNKEKERKTISGNIVVKSKVQTEHFNIRTIRHENKDGQVWYEDKVRLNSSFASHLYNKDGTLNHHDLENLTVAQGSANADQINIALANEALAQRMPNAKHNFRDHDYVSREALYEDGRFVGYVETHRDGSKSMVRTDISAEDGKGRRRMMTTFTHIDAKGQGTTLKSDGIINSKSTFRTKDGSRDGEIDEESRKTYYRLSAHYDAYFRHSGKNHVRKSMQESMFGEEEARQAYQNIFSERNYAAENKMYEFEVDYS